MRARFRWDQLQRVRLDIAAGLASKPVFQRQAVVLNRADLQSMIS